MRKKREKFNNHHRNDGDIPQADQSYEQFIENLVPGLSQKEYEKIRQKALSEAKKAKHNWRQKGNEIICDACVFPHAAILPPNKRLVGIDEKGFPILEEI